MENGFLNRFEAPSRPYARDQPGALFYLDPPYLGMEDFYGKGLFPPSDHRALAGVLKRLKGRFILTMNDTKEARAIYAGFAVETAELAYSLAGGDQRKAVREIIVSGGGVQVPQKGGHSSTSS